MPSIGPMELIVVLVIALVVVGPKKLPAMGRSVGKGMREFKESLSGDSRDESLALGATSADRQKTAA
jgi:sec-independent protein translocase protein TatA